VGAPTLRRGARLRIICRKSTLVGTLPDEGIYEGAEGEVHGKAPTMSSVCLRLASAWPPGRHCHSQRMAAIVHRGKHRGYQRGTSGPDTRYCHVLHAVRHQKKRVRSPAPSRGIALDATRRVHGTISRATTTIMADFCKNLTREYSLAIERETSSFTMRPSVNKCDGLAGTLNVCFSENKKLYDIS